MGVLWSVAKPNHREKKNDLKRSGQEFVASFDIWLIERRFTFFPRVQTRVSATLLLRDPVSPAGPLTNAQGSRGCQHLHTSWCLGRGGGGGGGPNQLGKLRQKHKQTGEPRETDCSPVCLCYSVRK